MMTNLMRRLHREQEGYALVTAVLLLAVMMILLEVALQAGSSALERAHKDVQWTRTLVIAEQGINDSVTMLGESRSAVNPCPMSSTPCSGGGGEYQLDWTGTATGGYVVTSIGYYPTQSEARFTREVQATYEPVPSFRYAIFSQNALEIKNGVVVIGDVYSQGEVTIGTLATVCGSVTTSGGGVSLQNGSQVLKTYSFIDAAGTETCSGKSGLVWTGGSTGILGTQQVVIGGDATASAPASASCAPNSNDYAIDISGGGVFTVSGAATACGKATGISGYTSKTQGTQTAPPPTVSLPAFTFDPANYPTLTCYPTGGVCGSNESPTAFSDFNDYVVGNKNSLSGTFAVWQTNPSQATLINLDGIILGGDFTLITNAPIDFGNTSTITTTAPSAEMVVVSLYIPPASSSCDVNGGDCSIYGQNAIEFDPGSRSDPNDGVVGLLYTTGKMAFKNQGSPGEGAIYATGMDLKNGFDIVYNSRIERVLGFGESLQQVLWQEINV